jgi:glutamate carboxypeptidase
VPDHAPARQTDVLASTMLAVLEDLVMTETPSNDPGLLRIGIGLTSRLVHRLLGEVPEVVECEGRQHLRVRGGSTNPILVLCHLDTVWPAGTVARWPFLVTDGLATGPGVFDMKAGLVQGLHALSTASCAAEVTLLVTTDEEIGSPTSRSLIEDEARSARAVLVLEPSAGGALKTGRKGVSMYRLSVEGRAAHAGLEPERGVNAAVELAHQILDLVRLENTDVGTTVTPTTAVAGTTSNTVPAQATVQADVRAWTVEEQQRVDQGIAALRPHDQGARLLVAGGVNRPPLEERWSVSLAELADRCADELGFARCGRAKVGGGSDGNFTAALGVPTLDGLGAVGAHAHAEGEYVEVRYLVQRATLLRALIERVNKAVEI